jgi:hypothetical protein
MPSGDALRDALRGCLEGCLEGSRYDAVPPIRRRSFLNVPCGFTPYGFFFKKCQYDFLKAKGTGLFKNNLIRF